MQKPGAFLLFLSLFFIPFLTRAQSDTTGARKDTADFYEMSLEQLLKIKAHGLPSELEKLINSLITVASKKPLNTRESPSIISLITEEDIRKSGARDLVDVLRLVPGFDFGMDVEGVVGLGMRGNWAHEGKILLLLDGQEMNEILFATTQFGNHYPIEQIKRIEIIRGPGSAIYGGFAEYGVINIITRQGEDLNGLLVSGTYGQYKQDFSRRNLNLSVGKKINNFEYSLSGLIGQAKRSDREYVDFSGDSYRMNGSSSLMPKYFNAAIAFKGLSLRCIGDYYQTTMRDGYGSVVRSGNVTSHFNSLYTELKYNRKINQKLSLTARVNHKRQTPWASDAYDGKEAYSKTAARITGNITASYNVSRYVNFVAGTEAYADAAVDNIDSSYFSNGKQRVSYNNYAFFLQGLVKTRPVNIILGARYDKHSSYGEAFVPRVGFTKKYGRFHFKALYSGAFRAPAIENINFQTESGIRPELTSVGEVELGYQLTRKSLLTVNVFDISTRNPIVYFTDSTNSDYYVNSGGAGTQGIEAEYKVRAEWGHLAFNYSYYTAADKSKIEDYEVAGDKAALMGLANHKLNLNATWNITDALSLCPTASFIGPRWAYTSVDSAGNSVAEKIRPTLLLNLFAWYSTPVKGLSVGLGVYNVLDQKYDFIQPYNGYHAPLPGSPREFVFRLQYILNFKTKAAE